jgi:uncharacterized protein YcbX
MTVVGRVAALWRYPVKSMAAEELDGAEVSWHGLAPAPHVLVRFQDDCAG